MIIKKFWKHRWHKYLNKGKLYKCATCGAPILKDKRVRYCGLHTESKGTKIHGYNEFQNKTGTV